MDKCSLPKLGMCILSLVIIIGIAFGMIYGLFKFSMWVWGN